MGRTERRYEMLYGKELYDLLEKKPLAWLPLGILEHHGEHLPWGLDGLKAHGVCIRLADRLGGVVLPATHLAGIHGDRREEDPAVLRRRFADIREMRYREDTFRTYLTETFDGLSNMGFQAIVAYTGHYPGVQTRNLTQAVDAFNSGSGATVIPFWEPLACGGGDHGGKWESSIYMALVPGGVRMEAIRDDETGKLGSYRGQDVRCHTSLEFGEQAILKVEAWMADAIDKAFAERSG